MKDNDTIKLDNKTYNIKNNKVIEDNLKTDFMQNNMLTLIVSDDVCNNKELTSSNVNVNFANKDKEKRETEFQ